MKINKKFTWRLVESFTSKGPYYWESDTIRLDVYGFHESCQPKVSATYMARHTGPNTVYAHFSTLFDHFSNINFGYTMSKHFQGPNAHLKARAWCDWLLNNPPTYCREFSCEIEKAKTTTKGEP